MYYVYILYSLSDKKFYTGFTENVAARVKDHNAGKNISTRNRRPLKLLYYEYHLSKTDALRREKYFKQTRGKTTIKRILRHSLAAL